MQQDTSFQSSLAVRERYRDDYWRNDDPIANDRLLGVLKPFGTRFISFRARRFLSSAAEKGSSHARSYGFAAGRIQLPQ